MECDYTCLNHNSLVSPKQKKWSPKGEIINGVKSPLPANGMTIHSSHGLNVFFVFFWGGGGGGMCGQRQIQQITLTSDKHDTPPKPFKYKYHKNYL